MKTIYDGDLELEESIIAAMLSTPKACAAFASELKPEHFTYQKLREYFTAASELFGDGLDADPITVSQKIKDDRQLENGERSYITDLTIKYSPSSHENSTSWMAEKLVEAYKARQVALICDDLAKAAGNNDITKTEIVEKAEKRLALILANVSKRKPERLNKFVGAVAEEVETQLERGTPGLAMGFRSLDSLSSGLGPGELALVGARPSMGKTTFLLNIAVNIAKAGGVVLLFSLETTKEIFTKKIISFIGGLDFEKVKSGAMSSEEWGRFRNAKALADQLPIYISDSPSVGVIDVKAGMEQVRAEAGGIAFVGIDYIQLMRMRHHKDDNRSNELGEVSRGIKLLASDGKIPIMALSQLSRALEIRQNKRPMLSDLRESGSLEQDADQVYFVYRDEYYNPKGTQARGEAEIILAKNRNGRIGTETLYFQAAKSAFIDKS